MKDIFKDDFFCYSKKLAFHKKLGKIANILSFGFIGNKKNIQYYSEKYIKSKEDLRKYNELINKADALDNILEETNKLDGVRNSKYTFTNIDNIYNTDYGIDWDLLRDQILQRDNFECQEQDGYCNGSLQAHHIIPLSNGGTNTLTNLITLCKYHHSLKHDHMRNTL
ncbi:endonuclease [Candidatus Scalindua japonica]|uniref:Endonuclease n=1 Tax=Candidatus Scalindua japonica TaxID=1284222 RepID=A0A286TVP1_9BACT|nr:HNH endonuclease [Candidatus Scalindua japonica]GAX59901.1 endonuclease [Candidatus Scalindua japonica]